MQTKELLNFVDKHVFTGGLMRDEFFWCIYKKSFFGLTLINFPSTRPVNKTYIKNSILDKSEDFLGLLLYSDSFFGINNHFVDCDVVGIKDNDNIPTQIKKIEKYILVKRPKEYFFVPSEQNQTINESFEELVNMANEIEKKEKMRICKKK